MASQVLGSAVERAIYLDADVLVRAPLAPLFDIELHDRPFAAVPDVEHPTHGSRGAVYTMAAGTEPSRPYFNTGVLVIDVRRWEGAKVRERVDGVINGNRLPLEYVDQDALNAVLDDQWVELDGVWNVPANVATQAARIVQFIGGSKPWNDGASGPFVDEFAEMAAGT
jgi:lipopolysaccharide biosynthesis glycosyltransferase